MKLGLIALATVALLSTVGCTHNDNSLKSQVDALEKKGRQQDEQINELQAQLAKAKESGSTTFDQAWDWVKTHSSEAWNSDTSQDARARLQKCWDDLKASGK